MYRSFVTNACIQVLCTERLYKILYNPQKSCTRRVVQGGLYKRCVQQTTRSFLYSGRVQEHPYKFCVQNGFLQFCTQPLYKAPVQSSCTELLYRISVQSSCTGCTKLLYRLYRLIDIVVIS